MGREAAVGETPVRRLLPRRTAPHGRGLVLCRPHGAAPPGVAAGGIGPHPHTGLHTVTWLVEGELLHRDSLGSEQTIRPGQLNLMTAGHGVSHAEEPTGRHQGLHGVQLWVAQPEATRHERPAFEHHEALPEVAFGAARATVLVGRLAGVASPARRDTDLIGVDLALPTGSAELPRLRLEHALLVLEGAVRFGGQVVAPGSLAYLGPGPDELRLVTTGPTRLLLLGGEPFGAPLVMWWNFVGRSREEVTRRGGSGTPVRSDSATPVLRCAGSRPRSPCGPSPSRDEPARSKCRSRGRRHRDGQRQVGRVRAHRQGVGARYGGPPVAQVDPE